MRKKLLAIASILVLSIFFVSCGDKGSKANNKDTSSNKEQVKTTYSLAKDYTAVGTTIDGNEILDIIKDTPIENVEKAELFLSKKDKDDNDIDCYVSYQKDGKDKITEFELIKDTSDKYVVSSKDQEDDKTKEQLIKDAKNYKDDKDDNVKVTSWEQASAIVEDEYESSAVVLGKLKYEGTIDFQGKKCYKVDMKDNSSNKTFNTYVDVNTGKIYNEEGKEVD
ncbi:hypothetical protein [Clostridium fallax]|uniref:Peptidase propeptide and YPEB domain-containing protein n=1 Tax=Clostridium fallax TaxID=1533 RepID=A0A1M4YS90_9CLOT|nr:hypothetical protein [Clostridium fallax]SHF08558.1 hypothetical protein SAMN05443638_13116 [Clostridium fallax]SQB06209.1 Uncharacterised protein [Clostridium fallax]